MKNQNDLIGLIVSIVVALAGILTFFFTRPTPPSVPSPTAVNTSPAALRAGSVVFANGLPGGSATGAGGGGGQRRGGAMGFGGPAGGAFGADRGGGGGAPSGPTAAGMRAGN